VIGVRLFFVKEKSTLGRGKFTTYVLESGTIFGATKERKNIFLIVLNLVNLLTTNLHINYLIFSPPPVFLFFTYFFPASLVIQFGALRECLIPRERKLETLERVLGTLLFSIETNDFMRCFFGSEDLSHYFSFFSLKNSFHIQFLLNFSILLTSGVRL